MVVRSLRISAGSRGRGDLTAGQQTARSTTVGPLMSAPSGKRRIATRESRLGMRQAGMVSAALAARHPELEIEIVGMTTRGDRVLDRPLAQVGGKGLFVKELEVALDEGRADIAVHSMKDVPMQVPAGFALTTFGERENPGDAFVSRRFESLDALPAGGPGGAPSPPRARPLRKRHPRLHLRAPRRHLR